MYDTTLSAHLTENIVNADQIRAGQAEEVLKRIDAWLLGDEITKSIKAFVLSKDVEARMLEQLQAYRKRNALRANG